MTTPTSISTGQLIDRFGRLKAEAADCKTQMDEIKAVLIERKVEKDEGELFRIVISDSLRSTTDWQAVAMALAQKSGIGEKALDNLIAKNTNLTQVVAVRCNARITSGKGAL